MIKKRQSSKIVWYENQFYVNIYISNKTQEYNLLSFMCSEYIQFNFFIEVSSTNTTALLKLSLIIGVVQSHIYIDVLVQQIEQKCCQVVSNVLNSYTIIKQIYLTIVSTFLPTEFWNKICIFTALFFIFNI